MVGRKALALLLVARPAQPFFISSTKLGVVSQRCMRTALLSLPQYIRDAAPVSDWLTCGHMADVSAVMLYDSKDLVSTTSRPLIDGYKALLHSVQATYIYGKDLIDVDLEKLDQTKLGADLYMPLYTNARNGGKAFAGYVATKETGNGKKDVYIAWRGTILDDEWRVDADTDLVQWDNANRLLVHRGFINLYGTAKASEYLDLNKWSSLLQDEHVDRIFVTGHSLGGALATLCAYDIASSFSTEVASKIKLVTFSGPRVASVELAQDMDKKVKDHIRLFTDGDIVPVVPLYLGRPTRERIETARLRIDSLGKVFNYMSLAKMLVDKTSELLDEQVKTQGKAVADYHHAGAGLAVSGAALPEHICEKIRWDIGNHHNLNLILYLLDPDTKAREEKLLGDMAKA